MSLLHQSILLVTLLSYGATVPLAQSRPAAKRSADVQQSDEQKANTLFEAGQEAHAAGKLDEAVRLYTQALQSDRTLWQAEFQLAAAYYSLQKFPEAQRAIHSVLEQFKEFEASPDLKQMTGKAEVLRGEIALATQQWDLAATAFRQALELVPQQKQAQVGLAQIFIHSNQLAEAITAAQAAIAAGEDSALIYALLGNAQLRSGQLAAAQQSLSEAIKRDANNRQALGDRAEVFLLRNEPARAASDLQVLLSQERSPATLLRLATAQRLAKQYDEAIASYQAVIAQDAGNEDAQTALAEVMIESGKAENAIAQLTTLIQKEPNRADLRSQLAALLIVKQPEQALVHYQAAAKLEPANVNHTLGSGSALVKMKRFEDALALLTPLVTPALPPDQLYIARANIATAYLELKNFPGAAREYIWMLDYLSQRGERKKTALTTYLLGVCFDRFGDFEQALKAYQQFLSLATPEQQLEVEKVRLRLPSLQRQIAQGQGIKNKKKK